MYKVGDRLSCGATPVNLLRDPESTNWDNLLTQLVENEPITVVHFDLHNTMLQVEAAHYPGFPGWVPIAQTKPLSDISWMPTRSNVHITEDAKSFLGVPYLWGGLTNQGIDCSGLIHLLYRRQGMLIPRDAQAQLDWAISSGFGKIIHPTEAQVGDLITYHSEGGSPQDPAVHIALAGEGDCIIHAGYNFNRGKGYVSYEIDPYLERRSHVFRITL